MAKPSNHNSQVWDERRSVLLRSGRSGPQVRLTSELVTHQSFIDNFIKKLVLLRLELFLSTQPCFAISWCNVMYCIVLYCIVRTNALCTLLCVIVQQREKLKILPSVHSLNHCRGEWECPLLGVVWLTETFNILGWTCHHRHDFTSQSSSQYDEGILSTCLSSIIA